MGIRAKLSSLVAPLVLAVMVGTIAAAVNKFASPPGGLQLAHAAKSDYGSPAVRIGSDTYPREAYDSDGLRVEIPHPAQRIVSQSRPVEEYLYSIIPPQHVVGVSASAYEASNSDVYDFVEKFHPLIASDIERTLRLNPDLIIISSSGRADLASLVRSTGVPVYRMYTMFTTLDQVANGIRFTGYLTGQDEPARIQEQAFRTELDKAIAMRPANAPKPRIVALSMGIAYGRETLFNDIVEKLGGVNVAAEGGLAGYEDVNSETVLKWDPEWIITGADPGKETDVRSQITSDPALALTKAVRSGHVLVYDNRIFLPVSPFSAKLVTAMAQALYGNTNHVGGRS